MMIIIIIIIIRHVVASLILVVRPGAPSSFLLLVARPGAPSSVLAPSSTFALDTPSDSRSSLLQGSSVRRHWLGRPHRAGERGEAVRRATEDMFTTE